MATETVLGVFAHVDTTVRARFENRISGETQLQKYMSQSAHA